MMKYIDVVPQLLKSIPFHSLMRVSTEGAEHVHYMHMCFYYQHSTRGGGWKKTDTILMLLVWTYRQLRHRISLCPPEVRSDFDAFVQKCIDDNADAVTDITSSMPHSYQQQSNTDNNLDGPPLRGHTFVLAGVLGRGCTSSKVTTTIVENGGRVYNKSSLPPESLPLKYILVTSQNELNKQPNKMIANVVAACRRNWDIISVSYILDAHKTKQLPDIDLYKLDTTNVEQTNRASIINAATGGGQQFSKQRSGLCNLQRKRKQMEEQNLPQQTKKRKHRKKLKAPKVSGWSLYLAEKFPEHDGPLSQRSKVIASMWKDLSQEVKAP